MVVARRREPPQPTRPQGAGRTAGDRGARREERAVELSLEAYRRLTRREEAGLRAFLRASPWADVELELERLADAPREVDLGDEPSSLDEAATDSGDAGATSDAVDPAGDR